VNWRWQLRVNAAERARLSEQLQSCSWPRVPRPGESVIAARGSSGGGAGGGGGGGGGGQDPRFAYCYQANDAGYGPYYRGADPEYDWYEDADHDGIVCES